MQDITLQVHQDDASAPCCGAQCSATDLLRWLGGSSDAAVTAALDSVVFPVLRIRAGQALMHQGAAFGCLYFVRAGAFKCSRTGLDGHEQVLSFAFQGDSIGFDGICGGSYGTTAVALEDAMVIAAPYVDIAAAAQHVPALQHLLYDCASRDVKRSWASLEVVAAVGAEPRIVRFVLQLAARHASLGYSGRHLRLPMSRRDIASHLGLAHESVSRSLSSLKRSGCIHVRRREVEIVDLAALLDRQHASRRPATSLPAKAATPARAGVGTAAPQQGGVPHWAAH